MNAVMNFWVHTTPGISGLAENRLASEKDSAPWKGAAPFVVNLETSDLCWDRFTYGARTQGTF